MLQNDSERREGMLAAYAPLALVMFMSLWVAGLICGYGLIFYGLGHQVRPALGFGDAFYFAGTSLLTIGYGDIVPLTIPARLIALLAGASGLAVVAVTATFLFSVFASFQAREVFVVSLGSRAGAPPSGLTLLETYTTLGIFGDLPLMFTRGENWTASILESHLAYPILAYFRSSHDFESWIGVLGALLDASALVLTLLDDKPIRGHARLMLDMGRHATHDISEYFGLEAQGDAGMERHEFEDARRRLGEAGLTLRESESAWEDFAQLRSRYAASLNAMARYWSIPPAQWIGDRSPLRHGTKDLPAGVRRRIDGPRFFRRRGKKS